MTMSDPGGRGARLDSEPPHPMTPCIGHKQEVVSVPRLAHTEQLYTNQLYACLQVGKGPSFVVRGTVLKFGVWCGFLGVIFVWRCWCVLNERRLAAW